MLHEGGPGRDRAEAMVDHRLVSPTGGILLWEDGGEPVSLAGWGGPTPNGIRVGPVYTPPELRGRGYATALTAELSQRLLDGRLLEGGRRFCFLYTDLANPTSNAIYERIGYRRVGESAEYRFGVEPARTLRIGAILYAMCAIFLACCVRCDLSSRSSSCYRLA